MKRQSFVICGMASLAFAATTVNATTVRRMDTAELVSLSQLVVHGTVVANDVVFDAGPTGPANVRTITTIKVTESLKGDAGETVKVAGFGGQVGNFIYQWPGTPKFQVGDEAIVILKKPVPDQANAKSLFAPLGSDNAYIVTGLSQGHLHVRHDAKTGKVVVQKNEGLEFANEPHTHKKNTPRGLEEVVNEIKSIVELQRVQAEAAGDTTGGK